MEYLKRHLIAVWLISGLIGAGFGGVAGGWVAMNLIPTSRPSAVTGSTTSTSSATTTMPFISFVKVGTSATMLRLPPETLLRRESSVAEVYRRVRGTTVDDRTQIPDHLLGHAIALTSDGWFVALPAVVGNLHLVDLSLWINGKSYVVEKGVQDQVSGALFLKVDAQNLSVSAFGRSRDLASGNAVWIEREPQAFSPSLVLSIQEHMPVKDSASSETAMRRVRLDGVTLTGDTGAPVWSPEGQLLGIIESANRESVYMLPVTSVASSFAMLLRQGEIHHAFLGVRAVDAAAMKVEGDHTGVPSRGAWLRDDRVSGKLAVTKDSPAAKAGLKPGDVILEIERDILDGIVDLGEVLSEYQPSTPVTLRVLRGDKDLHIPVVLGDIKTSEGLK